jgi:glucosyl-3-phosphoglycerate synthase
MADFHQTGIITTLHRLGNPSLQRLEGELELYARRRPIALVLPALYTEFEGAAMRGRRELAKVISGTDRRRAGPRPVTVPRCRLLKPLGDTVRILHIEGKPIQELLKTLKRNGVDPGEEGKGRATWLAYGYVIAPARPT